MRGREPAAFNFIDLTQCGDGNMSIGSTSAHAAAPATMALLTPKDQQDDDARRAMPPPPARPEQAHMMLSTSTANHSNNGAFFRRPEYQTFLRPDQSFVQPDQGISEDHCRAYLDRQDGGRSAARQRRRLERPRPVQPAPDHNSLQINNDIAVEHPTDVHDQVMHDQVMPDQTQMQLGNHLTLATTSSNQQADAEEIDRMKRAQREEASRQRHLMAIKEQEQAAVLLQQRQAAMLLAWQQQQAAAARNMNPGGQYNIVHTQNPEYGQAPPPPPPPPQPGLRPLLPRPSPPLMNSDPMANNMKQGSLTVIPGSMNWMAQQRQQHFPAPNLMRGEGSRLAMHHCELTSRMTVFYASMVNVFEDVSFEMAQAVCMMLAGKESKMWPPTRINHHHIGAGPPAPEPSLIPQPTLILQQMSAPSARQSSLQAGPSQAASTPQSSHQAGPSHAASTPQSSHQAGPSHAASTPQSSHQARPSQAASTPQSSHQDGPSQAASTPPSSHQAEPSEAASTEKLPQARKASLARFLERRKVSCMSRIRSKRNVKEEEEVEEDTTVAIIPDPRGKAAVYNVIPALPEYQPSSAADQKLLPTHAASDPTTPPGTASSSLSKRKFAHDQDLHMRGQSGEHAAVKEDAATPPITTADYVMREYQAILKEFNP